MIKDHLIKSKEQILNLADRIMLDDEDLGNDNRMFAPLKQKAENTILYSYLIDLANKRIQDLEIYLDDKNQVEVYKQELIQFLRKILRERL